MSNNKQSSVEWLVEQIKKDINLRLRGFDIDKVLEQAKVMHKEEIENAFNKGGEIGVDIGSNYDWHEGHNQGHQYYNEIFGGNK